MVNKILQLINFIDSDGNPTPGLISTRNTQMNELNIDEQAAVFYARQFKRVDYVLFRRFSDGRSSQIAAYVVDNSDGNLDNMVLANLHWEVWLHGATPLLYIAWPTHIDILACARKPDFWINGKCHYVPAKKLDLQSMIKTAVEITDELEQFSAMRLLDGTFWDKPQNEEFIDSSESAHRKLIQAVVDTDTELKGSENPIMRRLLLLMVLIKYLEDRGVFPKTFFSEYYEGANSFFDVLKGKSPQAVYSLLKDLENKFNGDIFSLHEQGHLNLTSEILESFANLVEAKIVNRQLCFWRQYSFKHIPVEIISNLYQRFVQGVPGAVYTPLFLASLMLDYTMPYKRLTGKERVLDPACGSGVFLVGAFRRLINKWRSDNDWSRPDVNTLKSILKRSIYGIELDRSAIDLTSFSLCLAICDALKPEVIWNELKFDKLHKTNLIKTDFFSIVLDYHHGKPIVFEDKFDVIIGNPPFESKVSDFGKEVLKTDSNWKDLPDNNSAYLFLKESFNFLLPDGRVCLIQPAGFLYNRKTQNFRSTFFRKHAVDTIFDFVSIRHLFDNADVKIIALLVQINKPSEKHQITHLTFRRTISVNEHICFELDHYDWHQVSNSDVEKFPYLWRSDLLGGGRLVYMSQYLQTMRKLSKFIKQKKWEYGEGFIKGEKIEKVENNKKKILRTEAAFLTGKPYLPEKAFTEFGIYRAKIIINEEKLFHTSYTEERYKSPLLLFKKINTLPVEYWEDDFLGYDHSVVGIHVPIINSLELRGLYDFIKRNHSIINF
jgi:type I restriction-modification system DNA methylase subunit